MGVSPAIDGLVGRDAELAILDALAAQTVAGSGGAVLLCGEPGTGKTRLAREAADRPHGAVVSWGACRECGGAPPLWPWQQVLGSLSGEQVALGPADVPAARFQLFEQVSCALKESAATAPRLVVVDDLHRADEASLRLLAYLSETLWPLPLGMIVTYRDTEVPSTSLAASVIASLAHGRDARRCELIGLSADSVARWLQASGVDDVDAAELHERTGGNPLFVSESIRLSAEGARPGTPPRTVREVISERLALLPAPCREALEVAAVLGRDFEYPPLAAALRVSPAQAVAALDPAVNARQVSQHDERAGAYRFTHTLVRDAVERQLVPSWRAHLHARVFTALRDTGWGQPCDLAHHAVQARPHISDGLAAAAARAAAEAADRLLAWEDAAAWWQTAISLTPGPADTGLRMGLGRSLLLAGHVREARACFETAAEEAARAGDAVTLAASALAVGDTVAEVAADHTLVSLLDQASQRPGVPAAQVARLEARRAVAIYWQAGGQDESRRVSRSAVEMAGQARDSGALGAALTARQFTLRGPGFLAERLEAGAAVLDIATRLGDADLRFRAHQWLVPDRYQSGALGLVSVDVDRMATIAQARRNPLQRWWVLVYRGLLAVFAGRLGDAEALAHETAALGRRLGQPAADAYRVGQLGRIYWATGRLAQLEDDIEDAMARFPGMVTLRCMRALAHAVAGRTADAARDIEALVVGDFAVLPRDSLYLASLAILGEAAVGCHATDLAQPILAQLGPYASRNLIQGVSVGWGGAAWHIARLHWLLGHRSDAARFAATAQRLHRQWGAAGLGHPLAGLGQTDGVDGQTPVRAGSQDSR